MPERNFYSEIFKENPSDLDGAITKLLGEFGIIPSSLISILLGVPTRTVIMRLRKMEKWGDVYVVTQKKVNFWRLKDSQSTRGG